MRYQILFKTNPERAADLAKREQTAVDERVANYKHMAEAHAAPIEVKTATAPAPAKDAPAGGKPTA
jgi:hypothetical protein